MHALWVIIANAGFAKIYEVTGCGREIHEIHHLDNAIGHENHAIHFSDRPGRTHNRFGAGRHALQDQNIHANEQHIFIESIEKILKEGKEAKKYDQLAVVAPPAFLGELNKQLCGEIKKLINKEVPKDLPEKMSEKERIEHVRSYLDLWNEKPSNTR